VSDLEQLEAKLTEVRGQGTALEQEWTKERLEQAVADYFATARAHAAGRRGSRSAARRAAST
jgi:hypothetical protein